jgi:hypothetical protein
VYLTDEEKSLPAQAFLDILRKLRARVKPLDGIRAFMAEMTARLK